MSPHAKLASLAGPALRMQPDRRLARLAGEGSEQAFEEIVRRYRSRLVAFAAAIVPAHRAEDIVQESLTRVFDALQETHTEIHLRPWLYTIVRNRALNAVRDERVHVELDEEHDGVTPPPEILARREEIAGLVAGIKALPEAQRQALVGRELEGRSHDEIAVQLGITAASVRGLIFRARTAVRHAAGAMVPLPALRWLLAEAPASGVAGDAAAGGGVAAAGMATAGAGGSGIAVKAGAVVAAAALATGAGVGLRDSGDGGEDARAEAAQAQGGHGNGRLSPQGGAPGAEDKHATDSPAGEGSGPSDGADAGDRSGPGGGGDGGESGPGSDDHSGPGGGGDDDFDDGPDEGGGGGGDEPEEPDGDGDSGPGGGDDEPEEPDEPDEPEEPDDGGGDPEPPDAPEFDD